MIKWIVVSPDTKGKHTNDADHAVGVTQVIVQGRVCGLVTYESKLGISSKLLLGSRFGLPLLHAPDSELLIRKIADLNIVYTSIIATGNV